MCRLVLLLLEFATFAEAQSPEAATAFERGLGAFEESRVYAREHPSEREEISERYREAAKYFVEAWSQGAASPQVFTNAANSYYFAGDVGEAVLYYRRALALAPMQAGPRRALQHIRTNLPIKKSAGGTAGSLLRSLFFWHGSLSLSARRTFFMVLFPAAFAAFAVSLWRRRFFRSLGYVLLVLSLAPLGSLLVDAFASSLRQDAVVLVEVQGRRGDGTSYSASHSRPFPPGTEVTLRDVRAGLSGAEGQWVLVRLLDKSESWIPASAIERVLVERL